MSTGSISDRRQFAQEILAVMAEQSGVERDEGLRRITASVLGFTPINGVIVAPEHPLLPAVATVVATLPNKYGPDYVAIHFDLSARDGARPRSYVTNAQVQAANGVAQRYAGEERYPLLVFTLPDGSGVQFVTGNPEPGNPYRLRDALRVTAYWRGSNRTALDCLERAGNAIVNGAVPQQAFRDAFDVQPVTDAFFKDYKAAYDDAVKLIADGIGRADAERFTQTLFNRLLFVHFVSRKGWLSFNDDTDYLNALWNDYQAKREQSNFYNSRLTTLFFAGLNNPQSQNLSNGVKPLIGEVPFLNGGLFEETELDARAANAVPDSAVTPLIELFNRYNFTVMEATPLDTEVAVDPEMLGKLFEETVNERHSSGAYYTPRPVVAFMCREAIKGYLAGRNIAGLAEDKIADLVDNANPQAVTVAQALEVANAVKDMKAVDPACGSGAFLLGMLQEIIALNETLFRAGHTPESLYRQKLDIISNNIYGADKDGLAVSTAMLRLWLSLAVDYEGDGAPDPLPNLDMKLVEGDAIAGPNPQQLDLTSHSIAISDLRESDAAYTTAQGQDKANLKGKVEATKAQLRAGMNDAAPKDVVEWRIDFAGVMLNGGFDVVIANPPYVRQELIGSSKAALIKQYEGAVNASSDLYCYFYARGLQLLRDGGMHVFVCSNSWLDVGYGAELQKYLLDNAHVQAIYESAVERQFATADINTIVSVIGKTSVPEDADTRFVSLRADLETSLSDAGQRREILKSRATLRAGVIAGKKVGGKWGGKYLRAPDIYHHILDKYGDKLVRLGDVATVRFGIKTGANDFFHLTQDLIAEFGIEPEFCQPLMSTSQESRRIAVNPAELPIRLFMCHRDKGNLAGTGALKYIEQGEAQGYHKRRSIVSRRRWYDLGHRDIVPLGMNYQIDTTSRTFYAQQGLHFGDNTHEIVCNSVSPVKVCVALNSTLAQLMVNIGGRANFGGGLLKIQTSEVATLEVVNPSLLPELDPAVFDAADWDVLTPSAERWEIDGLVFDALGLTAGERHAVYEGVAELVGNRKRKAGSATGSPPGGSRRGPYYDAVGRNVVARGKAIYQEKVRPQVDEEAHHGDYVVIDVFSEDYEIDPHISAGVWRLVDRHPGAITYKLRIGYPASITWTDPGNPPDDARIRKSVFGAGGSHRNRG